MWGEVLYWFVSRMYALHFLGRRIVCNVVCGCLPVTVVDGGVVMSQNRPPQDRPPALNYGP